jgi:peptidoglycan hydrolase-like protein with peptidoglycan-binding domain
LRLHFKQPIQVYAYGPAGHLRRHVLAAPTSVVTLPRSADAGSIFVSAAPRTWESSKSVAVSWFPAGGSATAVASPAPGTQIKSDTPITLTFSKTVQQALGSHLPPVSPVTPGSWQRLNSHAIAFRPQGYGYGLGAKVSIPLPSGIRLVGGQQTGSASGGTWTVPGGSTVRLQQILSLLRYLPLNFRYAGPGVGLTAADQEAAAIAPPAGHFSWRYANTPAVLRSFWQVGSSGTVTRGALMAFENDHGIVADGVAGPLVWKTLIAAVLAGHRSTFGYTFVSVNESSQSLTLWHSGRTVIGGTPVNTGIASAPTATGTYPVFEHLPVTTMSGTNPDGSHYSDPGIPDVSYFNGGDALHGFTRAQYGSPQSLGCVEMPYSVAAEVYPYTPIGTLVHVE